MPAPQLSPEFAAELRRIRQKLDTIEGPGVRHTRTKVYIGQPPRVAPGKKSPRRPEIFRMLVTTADAGPNVVLAKRYDGTNVTGDELPVRVYWDRIVDDEIYAFVPGGGTDAVYDGAPVVWIEMYTLGQPQYQGMVVQATTQSTVGWDFTRAYVLPEEA